MNIYEIVGAIIGSGTLSALVTAFFSRRKANAEAKQVETSSQIDVAKAAMEFSKTVENVLNNRLVDLMNEITALKEENVKLRQRIDTLVEENIKLRIEITKFSRTI